MTTKSTLNSECQVTPNRTIKLIEIVSDMNDTVVSTFRNRAHEIPQSTT